MRTFEICFLLANVPALVMLFNSRRPWPGGTLFLAVFPAILALVHLLAEGYRWQMIPAYTVTACLFLLAFIRPLRIAEVGWIGLVLLVAAFGLGTIWPVIKFPKPSGPFAVGTVVRHLVDPNRRETLSPDKQGLRELMIQIWYPAAFSSGRKAGYVLDRRQIASFFDSHRALVKTDAFLGAELSKAKPVYPVLIYSPSWHGQRNQNTFLVQELASHGFIVVAIDHPYGSAITAFPDGRVVRAKLTEFWDVSSDAALQRSLQDAEEQLQIRVQDVQFVLNELTANNQPSRDSLLGGHLDLSRVGILGFSFGGTVAAEACWLDRRFNAGADLDGSSMGASAETGISTPFFFINDDLPPPTTEELTSSNLRQRRFAELIDHDIRSQDRSLVKYGGYRMALRGSKHNNFSDTSLFSPWPRLTGAGSIDSQRALGITSTYLLGFFEKLLQNQDVALLDGSSPRYPEVSFEKYPIPAERKEARTILAPESWKIDLALRN